MLNKRARSEESKVVMIAIVLIGIVVLALVATVYGLVMMIARA